MGPTPAKVGRINDRDTQTTGPDPRSIGKPERKLCDGSGISH
jgi:hypothetical protein